MTQKIIATFRAADAHGFRWACDDVPGVTMTVPEAYIAADVAWDRVFEPGDTVRVVGGDERLRALVEDGLSRRELRAWRDAAAGAGDFEAVDIIDRLLYGALPDDERRDLMARAIEWHVETLAQGVGHG